MDTITLMLTPELEKMIEAAKRAKERTDAAYQEAQRLSISAQMSQDNVNWLTSFEQAEKDAYAALGRHLYRAWNDAGR